MPSTSYDFVQSLNRNTLLEDAYRVATILGDGQVLTGEKVEKGTRALNALLSSLSRRPRKKGEFVNVRKRVTLFLQKNQEKYSIGGSDHCAETYYQTATTALVAPTTTSIPVTSSASMTTGDVVGILLNTGYWEWNTITGKADSTHYSIAAPGLVGTAASGATVVNYTTALTAPLEILTAVLRDTDENDSAIGLSMTLAQYEAIADKDAVGDPADAFVEYRRTTTDIWFDLAATDASKIVRMVVRMPFSDMDSATDTLDCTPAAYRALKYALGVELAAENNKPVSAKLASLLNDAMAPFIDDNPTSTDVYFQSGT